MKFLQEFVMVFFTKLLNQGVPYEVPTEVPKEIPSAFF